MKFKYSARTQEGELQTGFIDASARESAINILKGHNLFILSLEGVEKSHWYDAIFRFFGRVKLKDLMLFTRQFSILLESKVPIAESLRSLYKQTRKPLLKEAITEVSEDVEAGLALSQALERRRDVFSDFYINMIRPAEVTGRLEEAVTYLADYLEKEAFWLSRVRNAMIYPTIIIVLFFVVAGILVATVFPQLGPIFAESDVKLPLVTQILLWSGDFVSRWWLAILLVLTLGIIMLVDYWRSDEGRIVADEFKIRLPIFGNLFKKIYVARFAESVGVLIKGGIPLAQGLKITARSIQNVVYGDVLIDIAEGIERGELFSFLLSQNEKYFPPLVSQLVAVGEGAGRIDEVFGRISKIYAREVNDLLDNLIELIQPVLILITGLMVGLLFASILLPIYNLARAF